MTLVWLGTSILSSFDDFLPLEVEARPKYSESTDQLPSLRPLRRLGRSIGVSNFNETVLAEVLKTARIKPAVNQIKYHAYNVDEQAKSVALCREHGILVEAYSALTPITSMPGASLPLVVISLVQLKDGS